MADRSRPSTRTARGPVDLLPALLALGACVVAEPASEPPLEEARAALESGSDDEAVALLETWLEATPGASPSSQAQAHRWAAHGHALLGEPELALWHIDAALELAPDDPWLHYARGTALHTMGDYEQALEAYARALTLDPRHIKAAQWRGHTLALLGRHGEALEEYDRALAILAEADAEEIASWGGRLDQLERWTLAARAASVSALGGDAPGATEE